MIHVDIVSTARVFGTTWFPHEMNTLSVAFPTLIMVSPVDFMISFQCTEHPQMYY